MARINLTVNLEYEEVVERLKAEGWVIPVRCKYCKHRDPEDHKCDCGEMERQGCLFPVDDDYYCFYGQTKVR